MEERKRVTRRTFVGGVATALGYMSLKPESLLWAQGRGAGAAAAAQQQAAARTPWEEYDAMAKLANNENPHGPPESVMKAMNDAWKYSNRYGFPDPGLVGEIAKHHGVKNENIMITSGSGELLQVVGSTYLLGSQKKVVGVEPTYMSVYQHASNIKAQGITIPLRSDYTQDIPAIIQATKKNYRDVGFVYVCNPNNPTGNIIPKNEIKQLLDALPEDMPVLIDEAYHHFIYDPRYETSIPYVIEGRPVIVIRTFSKIVGLAGMRLGYAVAPAEIIQKMRPFSTGSVNALVKFGGVAALKDTAAQEQAKRINRDQREKTVAQLKALGYESIPSECNFFMVGLKRPVVPVIEEFRKRGVLVGRAFPPMTEHLRVSVGTSEEMDRFMVAFREIFTQRPESNNGRGGRGGRP